MSTMSENIGELAKALAAVQKEMKGAVKDSSNPFFKSKYADLESVWESCRELLAKNGLCIIQTNSFSIDAGITLVTTLAHTSGQWIRGELPIRATKDDPQSVGAAITYARRFAMSAMLGVIQVDDDGESAMGRGTPSGIGQQRPDPSQPRVLPHTSSGSAAYRQPSVGGGECPHEWAPSQFKLGEDYCKRCRAKRARTA